MDDVTASKLLISLLDLTSLNLSDTNDKIKNLCMKGQTLYGDVAAICVYPQFVAFAKKLLPSHIKVATVINFPAGLADIALLQKEITFAVASGADELDVVLPYRTMLSHDIKFCSDYLAEARKGAAKKTLKIIIESGELKTVAAIKQAALLCIDAEADFIKTSTGKTDISATPEAANIILETINQNNKNIGFKASGGIKTLDDAKKYLTLAQSIMGPAWVNSSHFRIGASSVLNNLLEVINRGY